MKDFRSIEQIFRQMQDVSEAMSPSVKRAAEALKKEMDKEPNAAKKMKLADDIMKMVLGEEAMECSDAKQAYAKDTPMAASKEKVVVDGVPSAGGVISKPVVTMEDVETEEEMEEALRVQDTSGSLGNLKKAKPGASFSAKMLAHDTRKAAARGVKDIRKKTMGNPAARKQAMAKADYAVKREEVELDEKLETDGPNKYKNFDRNFGKTAAAMVGGGKAAHYLAKKAKERDAMNQKNDPGAAKKHLALSVLDREKAAKKAKERMKEGVELDEATSPYHKAAAHLEKMTNDPKFKRWYSDDIDDIKNHVAYLKSNDPRDHKMSGKIARNHDTIIRDIVSDAVHKNSSKEHSKMWHDHAGLNRLRESTEAYGKSMDAIADKKKKDSMTASDKSKLSKVADLMRKEREKRVEEVEESYTDKQVKMAKGIAFDPRHKGGDMTGASKKMEKIKPGLSDHPAVRNALRRANEAMDPVGREDGDVDNDGDKDKSDKYLMNRRKAIKKAMQKEEAMPTGVKTYHTTKDGKKSWAINFTADSARKHEAALKKDGHTVTHRALMYGAKEGPKKAV